MTIFPQEILDTIVNELQDDAASLKCCSMSSWSLLIPARRSIFHHIRIKQREFNVRGEFPHFDRDLKKLLDLAEILENDPSLHPHREGTPTLSSCIRHLDLQLASASSHRFRGNISAILAAQERWHAMNAPLPVILGKLSPSHIEHVTLHFHGMPFTWGLVNPSMASSILKLLRSPSICTLDLSNIHGLPTDAVLHCPNLNDLRVGYMVDQGSLTNTEGLPCPIQRPPFEPSYPPPTPKRLTTTFSSYFLAALTDAPENVVAFKNLQRLSIVDAWILSFDAESRVIETAAQTLQYLHISINLDDHFDQSTNIPLESLNLTRLKQLKTLDVSFEGVTALNQDHITHHLPIDMLILLHKTSGPTSIEVLRMSFAWEYITPEVENALLSQPEWDSLDALLAGPDYPALKEVAILFRIGLGGGEDLKSASLDRIKKALSPKLVSLFPRLRRRVGSIPPVFCYVFQAW